MNIAAQMAERKANTDPELQEALRALNSAAYRVSRLSSGKATDHGAIMMIARLSDDLVDEYPDKRSPHYRSTK